MPTKSRNILADQDINYLSRVKVKNSGFTAGTAATYIGKHEIVTVDGSSSSGAYIEVDEAIAGIALEEQDLWVTVHEIREFGAVTRWALVELDTSAAAVGDAVYLSDSTAGAVTLTASARRIGSVVVAATVANGGLCFIDPLAHAGPPPAEAYWEVMDDLTHDPSVDEANWTLNAGADPQAVDAVAQTDRVGGVWKLTTGNADGTVANDGSQMVWTGLPLQLDEAGGFTFVECRLLFAASVGLVSGGFGLTDSSALEEPFTNSADTITSVATDACGFLFDTDATTDEWWACAVDTDIDDVHATTGVAPVADTWQILRMEIANDGATIRYYVDGVLTNTLSAAGVGPDVTLYPYVIANATSALTRNVEVDYVRAGGVR